MRRAVVGLVCNGAALLADRGRARRYLFRRILDATHQKGGYPTLYSNIYDLRSINAVLGIDEADNCRPFLRQELKLRLGLETHVDVRPFEVFVLTTADRPRLESSAGSGPSTWIGKHDVRMHGVSMQDLASALQSILERQVIDETAVRGS